MIRTTILAIALALAPTVSNAETAENKTTQFDNVLASYIKKDGPGVAAIISKNGSVIYEGARGMANIELSIPLQTDSVFRLGSITKQFTGAAIMLLHEQGKLNIHDDIHKYVPDFPTEGQKVTIKHLLSHTSGIANYTEDQHIWNKLLPTQTTLDEMLTEFAKHPMALKTGEANKYSNTGYVLLGKIIEVASKQTYADFVEQNIFAKLGMKSSMYGGTQIIANRVNGYTMHDGEVVNAGPINMMWPHAAGSLLSTVGDLSKWFTALSSGQLISMDSYKQMTSPFVLNDSSLSQYGFGLGMYKVNKYDAIGHGGGIHGFATNAFYLPEEKLYVAVLQNTDAGNPGDIALLLAAKALNMDVPEFKEVALSEKKIKAMMGTYAVSAKSSRVLSFHDGKVYAQRDGGHKWAVIPMSDNSFYYEGSLSYFSIEKNAEGKQVMKFFGNLAVEPSVAVKVDL